MILLFKKVKFTIQFNKVSLVDRDRERHREREFFFGLTFHHDHFGKCQEYTWDVTVRSRSRAMNETFTVYFPYLGKICRFKTQDLKIIIIKNNTFYR